MKVVQAFSLLIFLKQPQTKITYKLNLLPVMGLHVGHNFSNDRKVIASCFYQWPIQAFDFQNDREAVDHIPAVLRGHSIKIYQG